MRRKAREYAVQILYSLDLNPIPLKEQLRIFLEMQIEQIMKRERVTREEASQRLASPAMKELMDYTTWLVEGTIEMRNEIDVIIGEHSANWKVDRMPVTDRNILRLGTFELLKDRTVPPRVVMDEAIELARKFGTTDSASFVNGVLDSIHHKLSPKTAEEVT